MRVWRLVCVATVVLAGCHTAASAPDAISYAIDVQVAGLGTQPSDPIRTSNTLTLELTTSQGSQLLPLTGGNGTYTFPGTYPSSVFLSLQIQKQPDEYFCQRADATAATTAPTTRLRVECDSLGPEFFHLAWDFDEVQLQGGGIEMRFDDAPPILYGLWTSLRVSQDERAEIGLAQDAEGEPLVHEADSGSVVVTLPSRPVTGTTLRLQPTAFTLGVEVPPEQASVRYVTTEGKKIFAEGSVRVNGYGLDVASRAGSVGSLAIDFTVDATLETGTGIAQLQGGLLLSATNDPARAQGSFRVQDGTQCLYYAGQTLAIDAEAIRCRDAVADGYYYRPVYTVATSCLASEADVTQGTHLCVRTEDESCEGLGQFPRCE